MKQAHKPDAGEPAAAPERAPAPAPLALPSPGGPLTPARIVALQRLVGNAAVSALVDDRRAGSGADGSAATSAPLGPSILDDIAAANGGGTWEGEQGEAAGAAPGGAAPDVESRAGTAAGAEAADASGGAASAGTASAAAAAFGAVAGAANGAAAGPASSSAAGASGAVGAGAAGAGAAGAGAAGAAKGAAEGAAKGAADAPAAGSAAPSAGAAAVGPAVIKDPHADPKFQAMKGRTMTAAGGAKAHAPAASAAAAAQAAALPPANDAQSQAQAAQVDMMSEAKPGTFDRAGFIAAVREAIDKAAPKNLQEADDFKADGVKEAVGGQVREGKKGAQQDIKGATDAAPDPSKATPKQVTPMSPSR